MSDTEQVKHFNPLLVLIWILQLLLLGIDYNADQRVSWSIPIIGSVLLIQVYMIWKTNYDEMIAEQKENQAITLEKPILNQQQLITLNLPDVNSKNYKQNKTN